MVKKVVISTLIMCIVCFSGFCGKYASSKNKEDTRITRYNSTMRQDLLCLMLGYPSFIDRIQKDSDGSVYLVIKSGKKLLYDDKKEKTVAQKLDNPDLEDMMEQIYPLGGEPKLQKEDFDPGRRRVSSFFEEVYGESQKVVQANLTGVKIGNNSYSFNAINGAAASLRNVTKVLLPLAQNQKGVDKYIFPVSGTFNYRVIAGTNRLSEHAYAIAIDLAANGGGSGYWKWISINDGKRKIEGYPKQIINIFEKNNFIWGGKWRHFDIMHFEYRPELILKAKYFSTDINSKSVKGWYNRFPYKNKLVKKYIDMINKELKK